MISSEVIQLITGTIGAFCYGVLFRLRRERLAASTLGGFFSWGLYLLLSGFISGKPICYFIVALVMSLYAEIMARILKTPATPIITTALIPLIPGSSLYYTMAYAFESDWLQFWEKAVSTLTLASALALGIITVTAVVQLWFRTANKIRKK